MKLEINRKDWIIERLGDFAISEKGKKPKNQSETETEEFKYPYVDIQGFEKKIFDSYTDGVKCNFCTENDFLMVWDGSRSGLVGKAVAGAIGSTLVKINLPMIENHFAYYFLKSKYLEINTNAKGTGTPHVNPDLLWNYSFPIVPTLEQKAIVAKIEQLFSELDNAVANLKTAQAKLKIYRQAVLKKAFEGELTKEWREKNKVRFDWIHTTTGEIMPNISSGSTPKAEFLAEDGEIQFLKVYNLNFDGTLNKDKDPVFTTRDIHRVQNKRAITIAGDVLINIVGPPLGKTSMIPLNCNLEYNINQAIVRFRPNERILSKFLSFFMQNPKTINWLEGTSKATAGQRNVKVTTCRLIPISLPSILEQNQIVQEIESRLSVCDKIEETIETSLAKAEALRQSILKKAFEGKLLSLQELENIKNHPEYESAEALLKRIKNERDK